MRPRSHWARSAAVGCAAALLAAPPPDATARPPIPTPDRIPGSADFRELPSDAPLLRMERSNGAPSLEFTGELWSAPDLRGPWSPVAGATSPYVPTTKEAPHRFYRALLPSQVRGLFDDSSVVELGLAAPFQTHFELAFAGLPDGIFPPRREKPYFPGSIRLASDEVQSRMRVRGNSSLQECPFPKLKLKVSREEREGTPFASAREIDVGTHCAEGGTGTVGRLRDERAAYREALAYEIMIDLGLQSPRVRRALVEYRDTDDPVGESRGWTVRRQAVLLEDAEVLAERLGGRALDDAEIEALENARFEPRLIADLRLLHALLGNWDFALSEDGKELWNTEVIALPNGTLVPVAGDFDLTSWVTGKVRLNAPHDFRPDLPDLEREVYFQVSEIHKRVGTTVYAESRARFLEKRGALEDRVRTALVDEPGRENAHEHLRAFFLALTDTAPAR